MKIKWKLCMHIACKNQHSLMHRAKYKGRGIQREVHTPKYKSGKFGEGKVSYFIDGVKGEYKSEEELIQALEGLE